MLAQNMILGRAQHRRKKRSFAVEISDILPDKGKSHFQIFYLENKRMPIEYTRQIKREIWGIFFKIQIKSERKSQQYKVISMNSLQDKNHILNSSESFLQQKLSDLRHQDLFESNNGISVTRSLKKKRDFQDTSFEINTKNKLPERVWDTSLEFIQFCLVNPAPLLEKGFNTLSLFNQPNTYEKQQKKSFPEVLLKNPLLASEESRQFLLDLQIQQEFKKCLEGLWNIFNQNIFHEVLFICSKAWEKYLRFKKEMVMSKSLRNMNLPTFLNLNEIPSEDEGDEYLQLSFEEIQKKAAHTAQQISGLLYLNEKIKYINLMEAQLPKKRVDIRGKFKELVNSIIKAVFLTVEGYYQNISEVNQSEDSENFLSKRLNVFQSECEMSIDYVSEIEGIEKKRKIE